METQPPKVYLSQTECRCEVEVGAWSSCRREKLRLGVMSEKEPIVLSYPGQTVLINRYRMYI